MKTLRILVVDDEPRMGLVVTRAVKKFVADIDEFDERFIFEVKHVKNGDAALDIIKKTPPDIMILDYKLPGISGLDVLKECDEFALDMAVIFISAHADIETAVNATNSGAYGILLKPFSNEELQQALRKTTRYLVHRRNSENGGGASKKTELRLISIAAHELKSPLNRVEEFLYMLKDRYAGNSLDCYNYFVERNLMLVQNLRTLISNLLDLSKIETGEKIREIEEIDVGELARLITETREMEAAKKGISINLHSKTPVMIKADFNEISIIIDNLLSNAIKYNRESGKVDINIESEDGKLIIIVADNGIGMSREEASRLFTEFSRIKNEKTRFIAGTGLGLYIVKKIASLYGGEVIVTSEPDAGSVFTVIMDKEPSLATLNNAKIIAFPN